MRSRRDVVTLAGYFASLAGLGLIAASVGPTLPGLATNLGVGLAQIGVLLFSRSFGEMIGCLSSGPIIDRGYGREVLSLAVLILAGCLSMVPFSHSLYPLAGIFFILGSAQGAVHTGSNTLVVWRYPNRAHSLLSALHFSFGAGMVIAPILVAWFLPIQPDGLFIYWVLAIVLIPVILLLAASEKTVAPKVKRAVHQRSSSRVALAWAFAFFFLYVGTEINMGAWLYAYAMRAAQFSPPTAAYLVAVFWGAFMVGRFLAIFVSTLLNPLSYICGGLLAGVFFSAGIAVFASQGGPFLWMSVVALGLSMAALFPQAFSYVSKLLGISGRRTALLLIAGSCGGMVLPWLTGRLLESISPHSLLIISWIALCLALGAILMVRKTSGS